MMLLFGLKFNSTQKKAQCIRGVSVFPQNTVNALSIFLLTVPKHLSHFDLLSQIPNTIR